MIFQQSTQILTTDIKQAKMFGTERVNLNTDARLYAKEEAFKNNKREKSYKILVWYGCDSTLDTNKQGSCIKRSCCF